MRYNIRNCNNIDFRYKGDEQLFAGLVILETDKDSHEMLDIYESSIDTILEKFVSVKSRSENDIYKEIKEVCADSIDGLNYNYVEEILEAFTTFFLYDFNTKRFVISRNIVCEENKGTVVVSTKDGKINLVDFLLTTSKEKEISYKGASMIIIKALLMVLCLVIVICASFQFIQHSKSSKEKTGDEISWNDTSGSISTVNLNVINELTTEGRLYVKGDSNLVIKYFVTKDKTDGKDVIDWANCSLLHNNDTLYPKGNCTIFLRSTLKSESENKYRQEVVNFNFCSYIEMLINTNTSKVKEVLSYSFNKPLTICYDNVIEDVCKEPSDEGIIDNLRMSLKEGGYHIDSVALYSDSDIMQNILSKQYPQIKYIGCSSN